MMVDTASERGQVSQSAAEVYDEFFLPALFQQWPSRVIDAAGIRPGQFVLDVACGTGVLARSVADRVGPTGRVVGLDVNEGMLAVAKRQAPAIEWRSGPAEALPFDDDRFDAVVSQFGLMFFTDRLAAVKEMRRVLRSGGRLAVAVWDRLEATPGYAVLTDLLLRLFGGGVADALRVPFRLGDTTALVSLFVESGVSDVEVATHTGTARFQSIQAWVYTDVKGWTLGDMLDDAQYGRLLAEAENALKPFVGEDGSVVFDLPAHVVTGTKR